MCVSNVHTYTCHHKLTTTTRCSRFPEPGPRCSDRLRVPGSHANYPCMLCQARSTLQTQHLREYLTLHGRSLADPVDDIHFTQWMVAQGPRFLQQQNELVNRLNAGEVEVREREMVEQRGSAETWISFGSLVLFLLREFGRGLRMWVVGLVFVLMYLAFVIAQ